MHDLLAEKRRSAASVEEMAERYQNFTHHGAPSWHVWTGTLQPLPPGSDVVEILNDLSNDRRVMVDWDGRVSHDPDCVTVHAAPPFEVTRDRFSTTFHLEVQWAGPPAHPAVRCRNPEISKRAYADHPHLYMDERICPVTPWRDEWHWRIHTVADYMDQVAVWLVKHMGWLAAGRGVNWVGTASPHDIQELLVVVGRNDQCPCGSGKKFKKCCLPKFQQRHSKN